MLIKEKITLKAPRADYYTGLSYHKETTAGDKTVSPAPNPASRRIFNFVKR